MVKDSCATSSSKGIRTMSALLFMTGILFLVFSFLITSFFFIEFRIETEAYSVAQAGAEHALQPSLSAKQSSCLNLQSAEIIGVSHYIQQYLLMIIAFFHPPGF